MQSKKIKLVQAKLLGYSKLPTTVFDQLPVTQSATGAMKGFSKIGGTKVGVIKED